ncbi:EamA family transporter [Priestia megaterium]|uniref:DMT family transporter n=1 Tax=Priestia TaxID=2800373 RepID=UPI000D51910B|nr:DMT family transporter [Priestia megaterium]MBU8852803.1 DMT family transporter [Bacillus sp. FJAT-26377]PVC66053.1 EamA family transporter [Priestia megaterium]
MKLTFSLVFLHLLMISLWASAFPVIQIGLESFSPQHLAVVRLSIASVVLLVIAIATRMRLPDIKDIPLFLVLGFLGFTVYHTALNIGEKTVSAGIASLLVSTTPIFSSFLAVFFFREEFGKRKWIGSAVSFVGVALLTFSKENFVHSANGILLILLAALAESIYIVCQKDLLKKYGFLSFVTYSIWGATISMLIFLPGLGTDFLNISFRSAISVIYLGLFPTVIPYIILAYLTSRVGSAEAAISLYLTPALSFFLAWLLLKDIPSVASIVGSIITLCGVLLTHSKRRAVVKKTRFTIQR